MPATAEAPAREKQMPLGISRYNPSSEKEHMARVRHKVASGILPLIGVGATIAMTAAANPSVTSGVLLLAAEIALGGLSIYILWPKHNPKQQ